MRRVTPLCLLSWIVASLASLSAQSTYTPIDIGTDGSPRGYWEFLPSAYDEQPGQTFPILIFFHGLGQGGNGTTDLTKLLVDGPTMVLDQDGTNGKPLHPLNGLFEEREVIVLAPQSDDGVWWTYELVRDFIDYALDHYRVDDSRVYLTGLSAGSSGVHSFLNNNEEATRATAVLVCAVRGSVSQVLEQGPVGGHFEDKAVVACEGIPYWALTAIGDHIQDPSASVNHIAGYLSNPTIAPGSNGPGDPATYEVTPTDVMASDPESDHGGDYQARDIVTALYDRTTGWRWESGVVATEAHPKLTVFDGWAHSTWIQTYDNLEIYNWLFAQVKPELTVSSPTQDQLIAQGQTLNLTASAIEDGAGALDGSHFRWTSSLDGELGTGNNLQVSTLSQGTHEISCRVFDSCHRSKKLKRRVVVAYGPAFSAHVDFGDAGLTTPGHWNNLTKPQGETLNDLVDESGNALGISIKLPSDERFSWLTTQGVAASNLYPTTAQQDSMYVSATGIARIEIRGLTPTQSYDFTVFASRSSGNALTRYTIGSESVTLEAHNNSDQSATLTVQADFSGEIFLYVQGDSASDTGYLGALTISTAGFASSNDSEADGLDDSWEVTHFGDLSQDGTGDYDGDGISNLLEFSANSSPTDAHERSRPTASTMTVSNEHYLSIEYHRNELATDLTYVVERSTDLLNWSPTGTLEVSTVPVSGKANTLAVTVRSTTAASAAQEFLRLRVSTP